MKKFVSIILVLVMCLGFSTNALAYKDDDLDPADDNDYSWELEYIDGTPKLERWSYTISTSQTLVIKNGTAQMASTVNGYSNVTKITIFMYLQQSTSSGGWKNIYSTSKTVNGNSANLYAEYSPCPESYSYRVMCSYYVYVGSQYEHIIAYSKVV